MGDTRLSATEHPCSRDFLHALLSVLLTEGYGVKLAADDEWLQEPEYGLQDFHTAFAALDALLDASAAYVHIAPLLCSVPLPWLFSVDVEHGPSTLEVGGDFNGLLEGDDLADAIVARASALHAERTVSGRCPCCE